MIYILHISPPLKHASHYVGFTEDEDVTAHYERHMKGRGSPLIKAAVAAGCTVTIATSLPGTRDDERKIKNQGHTAQHCPMCRDAWLEHRKGLAKAYREKAA